MTLYGTDSSSSDKTLTEVQHTTGHGSLRNQGRYPKHKQPEINYNVDQSFVNLSDFEDDGHISEELGEESNAPVSPYTSASAARAYQEDLVTVVEVDSAYEDAMFGSCKVLSRDNLLCDNLQWAKLLYDDILLKNLLREKRL